MSSSRLIIAVVDTNVVVVANGLSEQSSIECVNHCVRLLEELKIAGRIVIDNNWLILKEYQRNLRCEGQPRYGDIFLTWVLTNRTNPLFVELVQITQDSDTFLEFPTDTRLSRFDPADRKFIAVSQAHPDRPPIFQATDREWRDYKAIFAENNVDIRFLCEDDLISDE